MNLNTNTFTVFTIYSADPPSGASVGTDNVLHSITYSGLDADTEYRFSVASKAVDSASGSDFKLSAPDNKTANTLELREYYIRYFLTVGNLWMYCCG